jgi:uncharacterized membrane protein YhaH (DUF805 family)
MTNTIPHTPDDDIKQHISSPAIVVSMSFWQAIKHCFKHYADFRGKASRSEFWYFYLFTTIMGWLLAFILVSITFRTVDISIIPKMSGVLLLMLGYYSWTMLLILCIVVILGIPTLAAAARRLHDTGKSGNYLWLLLVPTVGMFIVAFILCGASKTDGRTVDLTTTENSDNAWPAPTLKA